MHTAAKKLQSQRGASIIFALLVFMLCAFAGVAALVSASANAGRYARLERDQQQYLSASSAAKLLRDELCGHKINVELTVRHSHSWWYVNTADPGMDPVYVLYNYHEYAFVTPTGTTNDPLDTGVCKVTLPTGGSDLVQALGPFLTPYFARAFLQSDVPSYCFGQDNTLTYTDAGVLQTYQAPTPGTLAKEELAFPPGEERRMVITGQDGAAAAGAAGADPDTWERWRSTLGTVQATVTDIGDYGLRVAVSMLPGSSADTALYATVFELPAQVERDIKTTVTVKDDMNELPADLLTKLGTLQRVDADGHLTSAAFDTGLLTADRVQSCGQRVTENAVTVTVTWDNAAPVVTRTY